MSHRSHNGPPRVFLGSSGSSDDDELDDDGDELPVAEAEIEEADLWNQVAELEDLDDERELGGEA